MDNFPENLPEEYKPLSMWGYFGYQILFSIPLIGFILLIYFAVAAKNMNLRNFARSYFCFIIIIGIIVAVAAAIGGGAALLS